MTPRQISALLQLKQRRELGERAAFARAMRAATNADDKSFNRMVKKFEDESQ